MTNWTTGFTVLFIAILALSCSSTTVKWYKSGGTAAAFSQDKTDCEKALLEPGESDLPKHIYTLEACLERKGWQQIPASAQ